VGVGKDEGCTATTEHSHRVISREYGTTFWKLTWTTHHLYRPLFLKILTVRKGMGKHLRIPVKPTLESAALEGALNSCGKRDGKRNTTPSRT
jgi:hypothetical protein